MTNNPRGRNRLATTPHAAPASERAPIPPYQGDDAHLRAIFDALAQNVNVLRGNPSVPFDGALSKRDAANLGLMGTDPVQDAVPPDAAGFAVWTSRRKFEIVTAAGLAAKLKDQLGTGSGTVSLKDFQALKKRVEDMASSSGSVVTQSSLTHQLGQLQVALRQKWTKDIEDALRGVSTAAISALQQDVANAISLVQRLARGFTVEFVTDATWVIEHNLGYYPSVTTLDDTGERVHGDEVHDSIDQVTITHGAALTGTAILR